MGERRARVVVASTSAAAGTAEDSTGPRIAAWLRERGLTCAAPVVVPDGQPVGDTLRRAVEDGHAVVITTGGTGIAADDHTPEVTRAVMDRELPGVAEAMRARGLASTPFAALSRGLVGAAGRTLVVNLPGSAGGVEDGLAVLEPLLEHILAQLGHPAADAAHPPRGERP